MDSSRGDAARDFDTDDEPKSGVRRTTGERRPSEPEAGPAPTSEPPPSSRAIGLVRIGSRSYLALAREVDEQAVRSVRRLLASR